MLLLDELMEIFRPTNIVLRLEIKTGPGRVPYPAAYVAKVVAAVKAGGLFDRTVITSFQLGTIAETLRHGKPMRNVWLVAPATQTDVGLDAVIDATKANGVPMLGLHGPMLEAAMVAAVRHAGLGIGGWACNTAALITKMFDLGVDVFTTDRPDLALAIRSKR
jgi:glycerophosphoryl diester phosphodiesterase